MSNKMEKLKDKIWTWAIVLVMILYLLFASIYFAEAQTKVDTILSKKFKEHNEFLIQQHKQMLDELENPDKDQMIYFDKVIIDKKNKKMYLYSSYDLYFAEELGVSLNFIIPKRKKQKIWKY